MRRKTQLEARLWAKALSDEGLYSFTRMLRNGDQRLIRERFLDSENPWSGCLATACGRLDPDCREDENPGLAWLEKLGAGSETGRYRQSRVVTEWDWETLDVKKFAAVFAAELNRRRAKKREQQVTTTALFIHSGEGVYA